MSTVEAQIKRLVCRKLRFASSSKKIQQSRSSTESEVYEYVAPGPLRAHHFAEYDCAARLFMLPIDLNNSNKGIMQQLLA